MKLNARKPASIRTAAVVALRRQRSGDVATFLNDGNALVQLEAARAIADEHIDSAMPQLARLAKRASCGMALSMCSSAIARAASSCTSALPSFKNVATSPLRCLRRATTAAVRIDAGLRALSFTKSPAEE